MNTTKRNYYNNLQDRICGPGGTKCYCCNKFYGKYRVILSKQVRTKLKRETEKELREWSKGWASDYQSEE